MPWSLQSRLQMLWSAVSALDLPMVPSRVILPQMTLEIRHEEKGWQAGQVRHCLDGWWLARMVGQWGGLKYSIKQPFSLIDVWILSQTLDSYGFMPACMSLLGRDARARWPFSSFSIWGAKCQQVGTCSELRIYCAEKQRSILHSAWWLWLCDREKKFSVSSIPSRNIATWWIAHHTLQSVIPLCHPLLPSGHAGFLNVPNGETILHGSAKAGGSIHYCFVQRGGTVGYHAEGFLQPF